MNGVGQSPTHPAIFASSFAPALGGVEELVRQITREQPRAGLSPLVLTERWPRSLAGAEVIEGTPVRRFAFRVPEPRARYLAAYAIEHRRTQRAVERAVEQHRSDVVHVQCVSSNGWYARRAASALDLPLVVTLQGELSMDANGVYERSAVLPRLLRQLLIGADAVTACSAHTLAEAEEFTGVELGERGYVIPNGVDVGEIRSAEPAIRRRPYVLAIGRHVEQKGFDVLLEAWAKVVSDLGSDHDLVIAGDGDEREHLAARAVELGIAAGVQFVGRADRQSTAALFRGCEFFVLPSRHEPFGIVNLEAMAAAKAVIATRVGGVPEVVIHGETGNLIPPGDANALAAAIVELARDPGRADRLGAAGAIRAAQFDWTPVTARYTEIY